MNNATQINNIIAKYQYSICTLVTKKEQYQDMINSFKNKGFGDNTEFLYIDNSQSNNYDGYSGLNHFLNTAQGKYIILCHQDILLEYDDEKILKQRLNELNQLDKNWALAGNAGGVNLNKWAVRITDPNGVVNLGSFPEKVKSLDENFIIVNRVNRIALSGDLAGFHLYGADICLISDILGYSAYVVDFHLTHLSDGGVDKSFLEAKKNLINKYQIALKNRYIQTTCTRFFISSSKFKIFLCEQKIIIKIIRLLRLY